MIASVPNFLGGVSQQPDDLRLPNQVKSATNFLLSPSEGAVKRYPTQHVGQIATSALDGYAMFPLDRDDGSYWVLVGDGDLKVINTSGTAQTIKDSTNSGGAYAPDFTYFDGASRETIRSQVIADTMFLVNTGTTVLGTTGASQPAWVEDGEAGFFVKQVNYSTTYEITVKTAAMGGSQTVKYTTYSARVYDDGGTTGAITVGSNGQTLFNVPLHFNHINDIVITSAGTGSTLLVDWVVGPGEFQMTYIGGAAWTAGNTITFTRDADIVYTTSLKTSYVANKLKDALNALAVGLSFEGGTNDSSFRVYHASSAIQIWEVKDSVGNTFMTGWTDSVRSLDQLPTVWKEGAIIKVTNDTPEGEDDYYAKFTTDEPNGSTTHYGKGRWSEWTLPVNGEGDYDQDTMPHVLVRSIGDGVVHTLGAVYFDFRPWDQWDQRQAGDSTSNPPPSFVGEAIKDIFWWGNRLGFLAGPNVILSEAGNQSNFWRTTVLSLPDSDPIDVASTEDEGATLVHAVPLDTRLFLFSRQSQLVLTGNPIISPRTVEAPVVSKFQAADYIQPVLIGRSLFFGSSTARYAKIREFVPGTDPLQFGDVDVTAAVPRYITLGESRMVGVDGMLLLHTTEDPTAIFVYAYYRGDEGLLMAGWSRWTFSGEIVDIGILDDALFLTTTHNAYTYLEKIAIGDGQQDIDSSIVVRLDRRITEASTSSITYDIPTDTTAFTLPYRITTGDNIQVVTRAEDPILDEGGSLQIESINYSTRVVQVRGDWTGYPLWFGVGYTSSITLNRPTVQERSGGGRVAIASGSTVIRSLTLLLDNTGYAEGQVTYRGWDSFTYPFNGNELGVDAPLLEDGDFLEGNAPIRDGKLYIPIQDDAMDFSIVISNGTPLPCHIVSGEWELRHLRRN